MAETDFIALIMAGGSGTRFWPLSKKSLPKQYLALFSKRSLIQETYDRLKPLVRPKNFFICTTQNQRLLVRKQLPAVKNLILEPMGKNTAPCLMLSLKELLKHYPRTAVMGVFPADHFIHDNSKFRALVQKAIGVAKQTEGLVTLGIPPTGPHTGYGYIEKSPDARDEYSSKVVRFVEKPDAKKAEEFLRSGLFDWNAGIFIWTLGALEKAFEKYCTKDWAQIKKAPSPKTVYSRVSAVPIDKAVLEKADNVYVVPAEMGWSDVGSWGALYDLLSEGKNQNISLSGKPIFSEAAGNLVRTNGKPIILLGVNDLVVIDTPEGILILNRHNDQKVREIAQLFDK
jgi:mannose-1-phosphate guanylyltransferase